MKSRWNISLLIIILTVIGAVCPQQTTVPNQEVILQFNESEVSNENAQSIINLVKVELQNVGVEYFEVKENEYGKLKITFFSELDVTTLKQILTKKIRSNLDASADDEGEPLSLPFKDTSLAYNLDVYEIENGKDTDSGFNGAVALELNHKPDQFYNPNVFVSNTPLDFQTSNYNLKVSYKANRTIALAIKDALRNIPEVRAGPAYLG